MQRYLLILFLFFINCGPTIRSNVINNDYESISQSKSITVIQLNQELPSGGDLIGTIKIGDSGISLDCGWDKVIKLAKSQCRKLGGNTIKILSVKSPDIISSCYRIEADIFRFPDKRDVSSFDRITLSEIKDYWRKNGIHNIEGVYEKIGGMYTLAIKRIYKHRDTDYEAIFISSTKDRANLYWSEGERKAKLTKTATNNLLKAKWNMLDKSVNENVYAKIESGYMEIIYDDDIDTYIKLFPTSDSSIPEINSGAASSGTGFALNKYGYIVTNYHVIENAKSIVVKGVDSDFHIDYGAKVVFEDKKNDLAIIKIIDKDSSAFKTVPYTLKSTLLDAGEDVYALGYPLRATMGDEIKLTNGIISSRTGFSGDISTYQISTPVQPGNSGGPLFDSHGNIVGIISSKHTDAENASYAIKTSYLINLISLLGDDFVMNKRNKLDGLSLSQQVKSVKEFVYIIESK